MREAWKRSRDARAMRGRITRNVDHALADDQKAAKTLDALDQIEAVVTLIMLTHGHLRHPSARNDAWKRLGHHQVCRVALYALAGRKPWNPNAFAVEGRDVRTLHKEVASRRPEHELRSNERSSCSRSS